MIPQELTFVDEMALAALDPRPRSLYSHQFRARAERLQELGLAEVYRDPLYVLCARLTDRGREVLRELDERHGGPS